VHLIRYERRRVFYELLKLNQTITAERYQQLIDLNRALNQKRPIIAQRKRKVILLHDSDSCSTICFKSS